MSQILIIEDDKKLREVMHGEIKDLQHQCDTASSIEEAQSIIENKDLDLVISDLILPGQKGDQVIPFLKSKPKAPAIMIITAFGSISTAVECLKKGADDFLTKPLNLEHFCLTIERLLSQRELIEETKLLRRAFDGRDFHGMVGKSTVMKKVFEDIEQMAKTSSSILIYGESGTGKELVAQALHKESPRRNGPFVVVNCASIPTDLLESEFFGHQQGSFTGAENKHKGLFLQAHGGTLFLDEISEMPLPLQAKLLRVLQEKKIRPVGSEKEFEVDVHIIAATNQDLEKEVQAGRFREDLFFRLETFNLFLPPLRERDDDLSILIQHFFKYFQQNLDIKHVESISPETLKVLHEYSYPGNIRELKNILERGMTLCHGIHLDVSDLPTRVLSRQTLSTTSSLKPNQQKESTKVLAPDFKIQEPNILPLAEVEKRYMKFALQRCEGNKRRAAALLGVGRRTLYRRLGQEES